MRETRGRFFSSFLAVAAFLALSFASFEARAAMFDPGDDWHTIKTKHFRVHFPERLDEVARKAARILEEVYPAITGKWSWEPRGHTEVVLVDNTDESNGLSMVLPYNWMLLYVAPPPPDSSLAHYEDWFRMLITHEFTHIVQIDAVGGFMSFLRVFMGKTVAPSGINPTWIREGVAQYDETVLTQSGRGRGAYSEMMVRTAILDDAFLKIDEADGMSWKWPSFKGAYVYGIKFMQYLVDTYGEEKFLEFDRRVRGSPMLTMINHQARNVWGKTFYELWNEWREVLSDRYEKQVAELSARGLTEPDPVVVQRRDEQYSAPALSPAGDKLAFTATSPHTKAQVRVMDLATGETFTVKKGAAASQITWSRDGTKLAWATMGKYKTYNNFYDLWLYDFEAEKPKARRITRGERARDPDFDPSGNRIVFVAGSEGTDKLKVIDLESDEITTLTPDVPDHLQLANPRHSPGGGHMALSIWKPGYGWRIYRINADGTNPVRLTKTAGLVVESRPSWTADARQVVFASDEDGISNIYRVSADGGEHERVSNVLSGLFQPSVAPDGRVFAQIYRSTGFEIASFSPAPAGARLHGKASKGSDHSAGKHPSHAGRQAGPVGKDAGYEVSPWLDTKPEGDPEVAAAIVSPAPRLSRIHANPGVGVSPKLSSTDSAMFAVPAGGPGEADEFGLRSGKYTAFGQSLFRPRFIMPTGAILDNAVFVSLVTGAADPLRWHNWIASGNYRTDANYFGYSFLYTYNRWRPVFGAMANAFAVDFGNLTFVTTDPSGKILSRRTVHYFEKRRAFSAFVAVPIQNHNVSLTYFFEDRMPKTSLTQQESDALNLGHFAGFRGEYRYGDWEFYPASISPENGRKIRLTGSITNTRFGGGTGNSQEIFSGDWREFILLGRHNVLALRAAGGITWGDRMVQGTFGLGGSLGEGNFGAGGSYNYFPLRGLPVSAFSRTRAMLFSSEWRFPIVNVLRGAGTVPLFLRDIDGAIFADYGNAWNAHEGGSDSFKTFFDEFMLGVGAELRANIIVGHGLPIHGRLGYGIVVVNRDRLGNLTDPILGQNVKYGILILALGAAF
mgnify:CR=1 FL=1